MESTAAIPLVVTAVESPAPTEAVPAIPPLATAVFPVWPKVLAEATCPPLTVFSLALATAFPVPVEEVWAFPAEEEIESPTTLELVPVKVAPALFPVVKAPEIPAVWASVVTAEAPRFWEEVAPVVVATLWDPEAAPTRELVWVLVLEVEMVLDPPWAVPAETAPVLVAPAVLEVDPETWSLVNSRLLEDPVEEVWAPVAEYPPLVEAEVPAWL